MSSEKRLVSTTIREKLGYESEVIERQLAHEAAGALGGYGEVIKARFV